ncbi:helix-turn-helix domain-containing protein [Streptomyces sp. NBC_01180]|uniref:helix-turn-helix domain-containing protein n=1 Tax=Streptomyces sp. NBC_01180 TaxID=2903763 RepID=UPI00386B504D|nr:helix-turn-helix domain-containing protein [Streptomyces sp. NBC_01180]
MATAPHTAAPTLVGSVQRALRLLEAVSSHSGVAPAKQLAREAGLPLPTAYHLLRTLAHEGYGRRENGVFVPGAAAERAESLNSWRDALGVPIYFAAYREGEIDLVAVADTPAAPAVEEWADFRETGHAHALGQRLLSRLDEASRRDHPDRHPVRPLTRCSVRDRCVLLRRLAATERTQPVVEQQEYALGTGCAAIPVTVGSGAAVIAVSGPVHRQVRLLSAAKTLRSEAGALLDSLAFSISI